MMRQDGALARVNVVQTLDSAIDRIKIYPVDNAMVSLILIRWIVIYPEDSAIQRLNNQGQFFTVKAVFRWQLRPRFSLLPVVESTVLFAFFFDF